MGPERAGFPGDHQSGDSMGQGSNKQEGLHVEIPAYLYGLRLHALYQKRPSIYMYLPDNTVIFKNICIIFILFIYLFKFTIVYWFCHT